MRSFAILAAALLPAVFAQQITPAAQLKPRGSLQDGINGCQLASSFINQCETETPGFDYLPASVQASCLCYNLTSYIPQTFDSAISSCASLASSITFTSGLSAITSLSGFCGSVGPVVSPTPNPVPKPTGNATAGVSNATKTTSTLKSTSTGVTQFTGAASVAYEVAPYSFALGLFALIGLL